MLSEYEYIRIITALGVAEQTASPSQKREWLILQNKMRAEMESQLASPSCQCEDRPCCSCDADVYQPADSVYDLNDPNNYDPEAYFADAEQHREACSICATYFEDDDNEDEVVQGFHAHCAE